MYLQNVQMSNGISVKRMEVFDTFGWFGNTKGTSSRYPLLGNGVHLLQRCTCDLKEMFGPCSKSVPLRSQLFSQLLQSRLLLLLVDSSHSQSES